MFDSTVTTTRGYCGVGCRLDAHARDGSVARTDFDIITTLSRALGHEMAGTNLLIGSSMGVNTSCAEYTVIAVDVRPIGEEATMKPALACVS
jgi:hypothetical protein